MDWKQVRGMGLVFFCVATFSTMGWADGTPVPEEEVALRIPVETLNTVRRWDLATSPNAWLVEVGGRAVRLRYFVKEGAYSHVYNGFLGDILHGRGPFSLDPLLADERGRWLTPMALATTPPQFYFGRSFGTDCRGGRYVDNYGRRVRTSLVELTGCSQMAGIRVLPPQLCASRAFSRLDIASLDKFNHGNEEVDPWDIYKFFDVQEVNIVVDLDYDQNSAAADLVIHPVPQIKFDPGITLRIPMDLTSGECFLPKIDDLRNGLVEAADKYADQSPTHNWRSSQRRRRR